MITLELGERSALFLQDGLSVAAQPRVMAGLLILREVMQHLGFTQLRLQPMVMTRALGNCANGS